MRKNVEAAIISGRLLLTFLSLSRYLEKNQLETVGVRKLFSSSHSVYPEKGRVELHNYV